MNIEINQRHMEGGAGYEHIASVRWRGIDDARAGESSLKQMVEWLNQAVANRALVRDGAGWVEVVSVQPSGGPEYIRTVADGDWSDNLLALSTY